ncbi:DoxX family protein [Actinocorallia sp. A-T 12471]|uniref:DoxX family protein n=1 Tax=Actinocorallia sp. A-T 12471 TaxID=3089813 RepID=UPI0029CE4B86|nr:DoxX family protein [Actinocorallia sp. A-T 12471]MDX6742659.1 DoxX family protein [Actinocorallia sp. A-T 12471]
MFLSYAILTALMSAVLLPSAAAKFLRPKHLMNQMTTLDLPLAMLPFLGTAQIAGAAGLILGLWYPPLGIAAAVALTLYFLGAVTTHARVHDYKGTPPALALTLLSALFTYLRTTTL